MIPLSVDSVSAPEHENRAPVESNLINTLPVPLSSRRILLGNACGPCAPTMPEVRLPDISNA